MVDIGEHERQQEIERSLDGAGRVSVQELATRFGVSLVTVRKDLEALERRRLLRRVRGGTLRRSSWSLIGDIGDVFVGRGRVARGFFRVRSLSPEAGLLELSVEETAVKHRLVSVSGEVYGLFDSSKVGRFALHTFAEPARITGLITTRGWTKRTSPAGARSVSTCASRGRRRTGDPRSRQHPYGRRPLRGTSRPPGAGREGGSRMRSSKTERLRYRDRTTL